MTARAETRILIADDQPDVLDALRFLLSEDGYTCVTARSPAEIIDAVDTTDLDVAVIDLNYTRDTTSGQEGFELLARLRSLDPTLPVLVMTAWGSVAGAVEAMRRGARDYIEKPWDDDRLLSAVATQVELRRAIRRTERLSAENARRQRRDLPAFVTESAAMHAVRQTIERIAPSDAAVLITGEHGTGKEVVALWLHAHSDRAERSLVTMNAGGLSEGVAESELFGHVKGAFTDAKADRLGCFELADEGTLFLDEIANMPVSLQAKLLRVLQTGELRRVGSSRVQHVNVRLISATNSDLAAEIAAGRFREDLLYRVNTVKVHLPPLRERRDDIEPLARHFLAHYAARYRKALEDFEAKAHQALLAHTWPGNVRELENAIERAVLLAEGPELTRDDLGLGAGQAPGVTEQEMSLDQAEKVFIQKVLARHGGDVRRAADQLGMSRSALYRRLQHHGL